MSQAIFNSKPPAANAQQFSRPASHDAELIRLCAAFDDTERRYKGLHGEGPWPHLKIEDEDERQPILDALDAEREDLIDAIYDLKVTTVEGCAALARTAILYRTGVIENAEHGTDNPDEILLAKLAHAVVAVCGGEGA